MKRVILTTCLIAVASGASAGNTLFNNIKGDAIALGNKLDPNKNGVAKTLKLFKLLNKL